MAIQRINSINLIHAMESMLCLKPHLNQLLLLMVLIHKKQDECSKVSCTVLCLASLVSNSEQSIMMYGCDEKHRSSAHMHLDRSKLSYTLTFIVI